MQEKYIGQTCDLFYQSKAEILKILEWIDGFPKNISAWDKWNELILNAVFFDLRRFVILTYKLSSNQLKGEF